MNILVTGSRGFIGQHLVSNLRLHSDVKVIVGVGRTGGDPLDKLAKVKTKDYAELNADLTDPLQVRYLFRAYTPNIIFHLAANPLTKLDEDNPTDILNTNVKATQLLAHYCSVWGNRPRFVFASSASVYGDTLVDAFEDEKLCPTSVYGATKVASEAMLNAYTSQNRINSIALRLVANVGRGATHGVLPDIVRKLRSDNPQLELYGESPGTIKPYMHVEDTVKAFIYFGFMSNYIQPVNIVVPQSISIAEVASLAMYSLSIKKEIVWLGKKTIWAGDNQLVRIGNSLFNQIISNKCEFKYKNSVEAVIAASKEL